LRFVNIHINVNISYSLNIKLFLHNQTFYDARKYNVENWLSTGVTAYLTANNIVQGAVNER
jgi:hypothetical protein